MPTSDAFSIPVNGHDPDKIDVIAMSSVIPMLNDNTRIPTSGAVFTVESTLNDKIDKKTAIRYYINGISQNGTPNTGDIIMWTETINTAGGTTASYVTTQGATRTSGGTALCSTIFPDSIQTNFIDSSGVYAQGLPTITSNKTVSIPFTKQAFAGVTILSINALGSVSMGTIPDGVVVKLQLIGIAA